MRLFAHYFWGCSLSIFLIGNVELETDPPYSIAPYIHVCALLLQSRKFWPSPLQIADHFCEQPLIIMRQRTEILRKRLNSAVFCVLFGVVHCARNKGTRNSHSWLIMRRWTFLPWAQTWIHGAILYGRSVSSSTFLIKNIWGTTTPEVMCK